MLNRFKSSNSFNTLVGIIMGFLIILQSYDLFILFTILSLPLLYDDGKEMKKRLNKDVW